MEEGKLYELAYLLNPALPEASLATEREALRSSVSGLGGEVLDEGEPRMRYLAYTIVKKMGNKNVRFNEAYVGWLRLRLAAGEAPVLSEKLAKNEAVIRSLLILVPPAQAASVEDAAAPEEAEKVSSKPELSEQEIDREIDHLIASNTPAETVSVS